MATNYKDYVALVSCTDKEYTYKQYYDTARKFAKSLLYLGMKRYEAVDIIGFNAPEYAIAYMGCIFAGGIATGIYTTNTPLACKYCAQTSNCFVVVADGMKQLQKYIEIQDEFKPKAVVVYNHENMTKPEASFPIYFFEEFLDLYETGKAKSDGNDAVISDDVLNERINIQKPNQCCAMIFTSGTTVYIYSIILFFFLLFF